MRARELMLTPDELIHFYARESASLGLQSVAPLWPIPMEPERFVRLYDLTMEQIMRNAAARQERPV